MKLPIMLLLAFLTTNCFSQPSNDTWSRYKWLIGEWIGEGSGNPGQGKGGFSLKEDLSGKVLVRHNHSEYPAANGKPAFIHDDLMVVYNDLNVNVPKAIYFDNEGHTINYSILFSDKTITFLSDKIPNVPVFRLTYTSVDSHTIDIKFELSQDGEKFTTYTTGRCKRISK
jgi:hypothetical protein